MKLNKAIDTYLASRRSLGIRLVSGGKILHQFSREMGDVDLGQITSRTVADFLHGRGQLSAAWTTKFRVLGGLYRFAIARGYVDQSPLPADTPELPPPLTPYVYSTAEIQRLLDATKTDQAVLLPNTTIGRGCRISKVVVDRGCTLPEGLVIGDDPELDARRFERTSNGVVLVTRNMLSRLADAPA